MSSLINRINNNLDTLFNIDDNLYKIIICNKDGTIPTTITKPTDIDIGVLAGQQEYLRRLILSLVKQLYIDQASDEFLKYQLEEFFDSLRLEDETDTSWIQRTISIIFQHKVSRATIILALRPYSTQEPEITSIIQDSAFADLSYADVYVRQDIIGPGGETIPVFPAISESYESSYYTIKITLYNTDVSYLYTLINLLDNIIAAGITYILEINYTT